MTTATAAHPVPNPSVAVAVARAEVSRARNAEAEAVRQLELERARRAQTERQLDAVIDALHLVEPVTSGPKQGRATLNAALARVDKVMTEWAEVPTPGRS